MSSTTSGRGVKAYYEMLILISVLVVLLASGVYLLLRIGTEQSSLKSGAEVDTPVSINMMDPLDLSDQQSALIALQSPFQSSDKERKLMVSELRVRSVNKAQIPAPIAFDAEVCPFTGEAQPRLVEYDGDLDGIPDEMEKEYGFDPADPSDADLDSDGDGFTNLVEYEAGVDPTDPNVFPSVLAKIRLARTIKRPFMMRFFGIQKLSEDRVKYQLNLRSLDKTYFSEMGDVVEGYKLVDFQLDIVTNGGRRVDRSRLVLEKGGTKETLVKGQVRNKSEQFLLLISLLDRQTFSTRVGESFEYRGKKFDVRDISPRGVTVLDRELKEASLVPPISEQEKSELLGTAGPEGLQNSVERMAAPGGRRPGGRGR
jgi:hypothetical protein